MKKYQDFLVESFDSKPAKWIGYVNLEFGGEYEFSIDNQRYEVYIKTYEETMFSQEGRNPEEIGVTLEILGHDDPYGAVGTGNQGKVFVTVIDCIKDYIARANLKGISIKKIKFEADKYKDDYTAKLSARPNVYKRLIRKFLPKEYKATFSDRGAFIQFTLTLKESFINESFINESFNTKPARWNISDHTEYFVRYQFQIDSNRYMVNIRKIPAEHGYYLVTFSLRRQDVIHPQDFGVTGTGNEYQVLVTVVDCIRDFVETKERTDKPVRKITFTAASVKSIDRETGTYKRSARPKVYLRLLKKFLPSNYYFEVEEYLTEVEFTIRRK